MLDILNQYLDTAVTVEMKTVISEAISAFDKIGFETYDNDFESVLLLSDTVNTSDTVDSIVKLIKDFQYDILKNHGIYLNEEASIEMSTLFIVGLMDIQVYNNKAELLKTTQLDLNANEVLAEVIALVCNKNADELLLVIDSVDTSFIGRLKDITDEQETPVTEEDAIQKQKYAIDIKRFANYVQHKLQIQTLLTEGLDVGFPFIIYGNITGKDLEEMTVERASAELVGMAIVSSDGANNPLSIIRNSLDTYITNVDKATKIDIYVNKLLMGFK